MGLRIRLLGRPAIVDGHGHARRVRGRQPWALLARILLTERALDRRELATELFPAAADPLGALRWCLAALRGALDAPEALSGDPIERNLPARTQVDVLQLADGELDVEPPGDLLEGVEPRSSPEFATWLLIERERIAGLIDARLRDLTLRAMAAGRHEQAVRHAHLAVRRRPLDEGTHILLVKSLSLAGSAEAALQHVQATEALFAAELGESPSAALRSAARRTVSEPPGGVSAQSVVRSLLDSGLAALAAGAADAGVDCLRRAVTEAEACQDRQLQARALFELGTALVHSVRGYDDEGALLLRQCVESAEGCGNAAIAAAGLRELGYVDALAGRRPAASALLAKALGFAGDADTLAGIHAVIGFNLVDWGRPRVGLEHYERSLEHARRAGNRRREAWSLGVGSWGQLAAAQPRAAAAWASDCLGIVDELRWVAFRPWPLAMLAEARMRQAGPTPTLQRDLEQAFALSCQLGDPCWEAATARALALHALEAQDIVSALAWLTQARERCVRETDPYVAMLVAVLADTADVSLRANRAAQAESVAREMLALAARSHMDAYVERAVQFIGRGGGGL